MSGGLEALAQVAATSIAAWAGPLLVVLGLLLLFWLRYRRPPRTALIESLLITPTILAEQSLYELGQTLRELRRTGDLDAVWEALRLSQRRRELIEQLIDRRADEAHVLRHVAALLGMRDAAQAEVFTPYEGLSVMAVQLPEPEGLRDHSLAFFCIDVDKLEEQPAVEIRQAQENLIERLTQRFEDPYILLCRHRDSRSIPASLLPRSPRFPGLLLGEEELRTLLWAQRPGQALAGYLLTRGLDTSLSPYTTAGEVEDERMFFGRERVLSELWRTPRHLLVGPRRIGKSSLLRRLAERGEAAKREGHDSEREIIYLDLTGVEDPNTAAWRLVDKLGVEMPNTAGGDRLFVDLLRRRYKGGPRKGVVLIDEFDKLARYDAAHKYSLLNGMRTLQAEGICSFVLTGFDYLYRESLNQASPLYNFATVRTLGPLEEEESRALVVEPLERLGVRFTDKALVDRIVQQTGGYPSVVQTFCAAMMEGLASRELCITMEDVERAERSRSVLGHLEASFRVNTSPAARIAISGVIDQEDFDESDLVAALRDGVQQRHFSFHLIEEILRQLLLGGFIAEENNQGEKRYTWSIPLLRQALETHTFAVQRMVAELGPDPDHWLDILPRTSGI